jgi:hypothetical protein
LLNDYIPRSSKVLRKEMKNYMQLFCL